MNSLKVKGTYRVFSSVAVTPDGSPIVLFDFDAEVYASYRYSKHDRHWIAFEEIETPISRAIPIRHDFDSLSVSVRFIPEEI